MSQILFTKTDEFKLQLQKNLSLKKNSSKTILFIEPYGATLSLLKHGVSRGYEIIILTAETDLRMVPEAIKNVAALTIHIDTADAEAVLHCVVMLQALWTIHAVVPGFEYFVPLAARVSEFLHLPGIPYAKVMQLRRKDVMRMKLQEANMLIPRFHVVKSIRELDEALKDITFPAVCKPVDAAGSVYVRKVMNKTEAQLAALPILKGEKILWGHTLSRDLLIEEYIDGKEFSLEGVIQNGNILHFSVTEKFVADQIEFIEIGHVVNPPLDIAVRKNLEQYVEQVLCVLGADHCPFHAEVRVRNGQPFLMEVAARLAGDKIGDLINLSCGINYFDYVYASYLGEQLPNIVRSDETAGVRFFYRPDVEQYTRITGLEEAKQYLFEDLNFYYPAGQSIPAFPKPLRRLGHVIIKDNNYQNLLAALDHIDQTICFQ